MPNDKMLWVLLALGTGKARANGIVPLVPTTAIRPRMGAASLNVRNVMPQCQG